MKVNREQLLQCLETVSPGLSRQNVLEQSNCFVFHKGRVLTFNDDIACSHQSPLPWEGALSAAPFLAFLRLCREETITIEPQPNEWILSSKSRRAGLRLEKQIRLPLASIEAPQTWKKLPANFEIAVVKVQDCAGKDDNRFALTCIHITPHYIEASDSYQIARYTLPVPVQRDILVRRTELKYICGLKMRELSETKSWVHFRNREGIILSCRREIHEYRDLTSFLGFHGTKVHLPASLQEAREWAEVISKENPDNLVTVELRSNRIQVRAQGKLGWAQDMRTAQYKGPPLRFLTPPSVLSDISAVAENQLECEIMKNHLKITGPHYVYVTVLGVVDNRQSEVRK